MQCSKTPWNKYWTMKATRRSPSKEWKRCWRVFSRWWRALEARQMTMVMTFHRRHSRRWWKKLTLIYQDKNLNLNSRLIKKLQRKLSQRKHFYNRWWKVKWTNRRHRRILFQVLTYSQISSRQPVLWMSRNLQAQRSPQQTLRRIWWVCLKIWRSSLKILMMMKMLRLMTLRFRRLRRWCRVFSGEWWAVAKVDRAQMRCSQNYLKGWGCKCRPNDFILNIISLNYSIRLI